MKAGIVLCCLLAAGAAVADDITGSFGVTSAYIARGTDQNVHHRPAAMGTVGYVADTGFYASVFAANMDFGEGTKFELDYFGGYKTTLNKVVVDIGFASINYPRSKNPWYFVEYDLKVDRPFDNGANIGVWIGYTGSYFYSYGRGWWTEVHALYPLTQKLSISGGVGNQDLPRGFSYSTFNIGSTWAVTPTLTFDARYSDTDKHELDPVYNTYDERLSFTVTKTF